jgi:hypothetical protein
MNYNFEHIWKVFKKQEQNLLTNESANLVFALKPPF